MADGFVTGWVVDLNDIGASVLGRFPTEGAAKALTPLIGQDVVRAMAENGAQANYAPAATAVTSDAVYWSQSINDYQGPSVSRYIFRAPLPQ